MHGGWHGGLTRRGDVPRVPPGVAPGTFTVLLPAICAFSNGFSQAESKDHVPEGGQVQERASSWLSLCRLELDAARGRAGLAL